MPPASNATDQPGAVRVDVVNNNVKIETLVEQSRGRARATSPAHTGPPGTSSSSRATLIPADKALQIAVRGGQVETVRLLLERKVVDPNTTDEAGRTPLMVACSCVPVYAEAVRLLLKAGADPTLPANNGFTPMHSVAENGYTELVDMLHASNASTVNLCAPKGETPIFLACYYGREGVVSRLLALGAVRPAERLMCPFTMAIRKGFLGVVRILVNHGMETMGGSSVLPKALYACSRFGRGRILRLLLGAEGYGVRSELASTSVMGERMLHVASGYCNPAAVSALLEAGADERALDVKGHVPRDVLGTNLAQGVEMDLGKATAIHRMLQRGPAYRARSWAWPSGESGGAGDGGDGRDPAGALAAAAAAAATAALPASSAPKTSIVDVRIFRPRQDRKFFVGVVNR